MKTLISTIAAIAIASTSAPGWILEKPIDYSDQLQRADFVGIVEVSKIVETGLKKVLLSDQAAQFRDLRLELKVLSAFKGRGETIRCSIYREPTREELLADGVAESDVFKILLNLGTDETLYLFPARAAQGEHLLAYLCSKDSRYFPVAGDLHSSRSLLRLKPSNLVNTLDLKIEAEQVGGCDGEKPPS